MAAKGTKKFLCLVLSFLGALAGAHTLDEGIAMIRADGVYLNRLIVKMDDPAPAGRAGDGASLHLTGGTTSPLFGRGETAYRTERAALEKRLRAPLPHLEDYSVVTFPAELSREDAVAALQEVYREPGVAFAYFEPKSGPAALTDLPAAGEPAPEKVEPGSRTTPDFERLQFYLEPAPRGVDARFAWKLPGGTGRGIRVIDIEYGWESSHEDFSPPFFEKNGMTFRDHGTAVWGEVAAKRDGKGVTGIAYGSSFGVFTNTSSAADYDRAAANLKPGDVLIIEQQARGPDGNRYAPIEYWSANFDALRLITARGIIVVAAAGNGGSDLDAPAYRGAFDPARRDSGAILVGAGAPPTTSYHLQRLSFSNYGARVDAMGYGLHVVTTGLGNLYNAGPSAAYTNSFNGTSSATPIVAGAVATLQGIARAAGQRLTPFILRRALRESGTPQAGDTTKRIGNLPDLSRLYDVLGLVNSPFPALPLSSTRFSFR